MMGERQTDQPALFYEFSLERHVSGDHLLRSIDRFVDLGDIREQLRPFYSDTGRSRRDGTFERADFVYDHTDDSYICPGGKRLRQRRKVYREPRPFVDENGLMRYRASKLDCDACGLKQRCTPNMPARKILRSIHEGARDLARDLALTDAYLTSRRERKKVEMLFAHLKRILKLDRLRLRGPNGAKDEFLLAATAQNLRKLAKLIPIPQTATA